MAKFREILRLHELGHSQCAIAQSCGDARSTVQDYIRRATAKNLSYEHLCQLSDNEVKDLLGTFKLIMLSWYDEKAGFDHFFKLLDEFSDRPSRSNSQAA